MSQNAPSYDIAQIIEAYQSVPIATLNTNMFVGESRSTEDVPLQVALHDTGGFDPDAATDYKRPTIMIHVTGTSYQTSYQWAEQIRDVLHTLHNQIKNGSRYIAIWQQGDILYMGRENNKIHKWSMNFRIHRTTES